MVPYPHFGPSCLADIVLLDLRTRLSPDRPARSLSESSRSLRATFIIGPAGEGVAFVLSRSGGRVPRFRETRTEDDLFDHDFR